MVSLLESDIKEISESLDKDSHKFSGKRILITGGRGFVGRYLTEVFSYLNKNVFWDKGMDLCEMIVLDNFITAGEHGREIPNSRDIRFVEHDIIKPFYPERPVDYIIHAAGIASPYYYRQWPLETLQVATDGLKNVLELARNQKHDCKLTFFSSSEIYGDPHNDMVPIKESYFGNVSCIGARSCYDESKRLGETLVRVYHEKFGVHGTIIRPFNVYGPGMQQKDYRVLPNFAAKIAKHEPLEVYGTGRQTRTFCYITDAIRGFLQVLLRGDSGEPYNIGNPSPEISMIDLVKKCQDILGPEIQFNISPHPSSYPADEPSRRCPDITKAHREVGFEPKVNLDEGLSRFFSWTKENYA